MAWYDFITQRTGALGSLVGRQLMIQNRNTQVDREKSALAKENAARVQRNLNITFPPPKETKIILDNGDIIWFDCATEVNHTFPSKVTEFPVEDGASISDHIVNGNATFSVTGIFSDARLRKPDENGNSTLPEQPTQEETYGMLQDLRDSRQSFSLLTPLDTYTDLVLKNMSMPRDAGDALKVQMEFEQIRRAYSGITTVSLIEPKKAATTAKKPDPVTDKKLTEEKNAGAVSGAEDKSLTTLESARVNGVNLFSGTGNDAGTLAGTSGSGTSGAAGTSDGSLLHNYGG